ncbi:MAG: hypothetical protein HY898_24125 [Deltaproteobacteria bacterium]|nr:hypothetical protein [Deltaproteobacteria bacterium]
MVHCTADPDGIRLLLPGDPMAGDAGDAIVSKYRKIEFMKASTEVLRVSHRRGCKP